MRKRFTSQFKAEAALDTLRGNKTMGQIASERQVAPTQLSQWRGIVLKGLPNLFADEQREIEKQQVAHDAETEKLYAEIGRLTSELNWLKKRWPPSSRARNGLA
jgi:transposase-like protein